MLAAAIPPADDGLVDAAAARYAEALARQPLAGDWQAKWAHLPHAEEAPVIKRYNRLGRSKSGKKSKADLEFETARELRALELAELPGVNWDVVRYDRLYGYVGRDRKQTGD